MIIKSRILIDADIEKVWFFLTNPDAQTLWVKGLLDTAVIDDNHSYVYIKKRYSVREYNVFIIEKIYPFIFSFHMYDDDTSKPIFTHQYELKQRHGETHLKYELKVNTKSLLYYLFLAVIGRKILNVKADMMLYKLKEHAESS